METIAMEKYGVPTIPPTGDLATLGNIEQTEPRKLTAAEFLEQEPRLAQEKKDRLDRLAREINEGHVAATSAREAYQQHALAVGKRLLEVKAEVGHGNFTKWVENNSTLDERTAQRYMAEALGKPNPASAQPLFLQLSCNWRLGAIPLSR